MADFNGMGAGPYSDPLYNELYQRNLQNMVTEQARANQSIENATKSTRKLEKAQLLLQGAVAGLTIAYGILKKAMNITRESARFEANIRRIARTLGESGKELTKWGLNARDSMGMSKEAFADMAATYSNLSRGFSKDTEMNANVTQKLVKQTALLAEQQGRTIDDVSRRIRSGILGSNEAIEDLGINVLVSSLKSTKAYKQIAGEAPWKNLSFEVQQLIRVMAILEQASEQTGNTMEQSTNLSMARFSAAVDNAGNSLGQGFMNIIDASQPTLIAFGLTLEWLGEQFVDFTEKLTGQSREANDYNKLVEKYKNMTDASTDSLKDQADALDDVNKSARKNIQAFDELNLVNKDIDTTLKIQDLPKSAQDFIDSMLGDMEKAGTDSKMQDRGIVEEYFNAVDFVNTLYDKFIDAKNIIIDKLVGDNWFGSILKGITSISFTVTPPVIIARVAKWWADFFRDTLPKEWSNIKSDFQAAWVGLTEDIPKWIKEKGINIGDKIIDVLTAPFALDVSAMIKPIWKKTNIDEDTRKSFAEDIYKNFITDQTQEEILGKMEGLRESVSQKWSQFKTNVNTHWTDIKTTVKDKITSMKDEGKFWMEDLREELSQRWKRMRENAGFWWDLIKDRVKGVVDRIAEISWDDVKTAFSDAWEDIKESVLSKIRPILNKINEAKAAVSSFFGQTPEVPATFPFGGGPVSTIPAFANGGIVTSPTMGLIGEAGSNEAVIPLNEQGLAPLINGITNALSQNNQQPIVIKVELDGAALARTTYRYNENERNRNNNSFVTVR